MEPPCRILSTLLKHPSASLSEDELLLLWKYIGPRLDDLSTVTGSSLDVRRSGRINRTEGPDVRDVELVLEGISRAGSVEIHRQTADWYQHDHHRDPAFNAVVLHVVLTGERVNVRREDDHWVQTVVLDDQLDLVGTLLEELDGSTTTLRRRSVKRPCYREDPDPAQHRRELDEIGRAWLDKKAGQFRRRGEEGLLQATIEALGYSRNHPTFRRLGERLDFDKVRSILRQAEGTAALEAYLIGRGGWFQREGTFTEAIYRRRRCWEETYAGLDPVVDSHQWTRAGIRPHARPVRRWVNFGWTLRRVLRAGMSWNQWVTETFSSLPAGSDYRSEAHERLRDAFGYPPGTYWKYHYSLSDTRRTGVPSPVGKTWFDQLIVNVILPYRYWKTFETADRSTRKKLVEQFRNYPATLENRRTRRIKQQWGYSEDETGLFASAAQQQGAVHLYKQGCLGNRCQECPMRRRDGPGTAKLFDSPR